jgi:amidase
MTAKRPTAEQIAAAAARAGLSLDAADVDEFTGMVGDTIAAYYGPVDRMADYVPEVTYPRTPGYRPGPDEDPLDAWYVKSRIDGAKRGKLKGKTVAIKDNICIAGLPMMNGASTLEGYVPNVDATVVTRTLDAGATILGKANCEYFCFSGGSHTNAIATTHNPYNPAHTTGGSSSGCAALVAAGEVDLAIGSDQGGSVREPSAFCGLVGMKATHGLVPYTGAFPVEMTLDHLGPMTRTTADNALFLEVLAGADGLDPRQMAPRTDRYTKALGQGAKGLKIGMVKEGFGQAESEADVDAAVRTAADVFGTLGAEVSEVSIPLHREAMSIWVPIAVEGTYAQVMAGNAMGDNWRGLYLTGMMAAHAPWRDRADMFSEILKLGVLCAEYMREAYGGRYYAKAQNLSRRLRADYDSALAEVDLLLMPTTPVKAPPLPPENPTREEAMSPGFVPIVNTAPFDCTGHPALNVPCALRGGLPVGMMLIGRHWDEATLYRAADAFERAGDWKAR